MSELPAIRNNNPDDYAGLMALAKELVTTNFLPIAIKTPAQAVAIILTGRELGLPPMQSLRSICIIQGKPELSADLQLSIFHRDGGRSKWLTLTATEAKLLLKHPNGDEHTEVFTMDDAKRAGLASGQNWQKYPKAMLRSRAITAGLKSIGFEPLTGAYAPGEIGGPETVEPEPGEVIPEAQAASVAPQQLTPPSDTTPPATMPLAPAAATPKPPLKVATANTRAAALDRLGCQEEGPAKNFLHSYLVALGWLENEKSVEQWPIRFVPLSVEELEAVRVGLTEFSKNGVAVRPYEPHGLDIEVKGTPVKEVKPAPVEPPEPELPPAPTSPGWRDYVMTFGAKTKGKNLGSFPEPELKNYIENFVVRDHVEDEKGVKQFYAPAIVNAQKELRAALDQAAAELATKQPTKG